MPAPTSHISSAQINDNLPDKPGSESSTIVMRIKFSPGYVTHRPRALSGPESSTIRMRMTTARVRNASSPGTARLGVERNRDAYDDRLGT